MSPSILVAVVLMLAPLCAAAQDYPKLRPGLWEMSNTSNRRSGEPLKSTICLDTSVQQDMFKMSSGMMAGMCSKSEMKASGNKFTGEAVCNISGSTMKSKSVMTMTGDTAYRNEAHTTFEPPLAGMADSDTVIQGRHVGACKPGQQPGDMTLPTGQIVNIRNILNSKK